MSNCRTEGHICLTLGTREFVYDGVVAVDTTNSQTLTPSGLLETARQELIEEIRDGAAGRTAVERFSDRVAPLLQRLFFQAAPAGQPVAVLALGGYGRRHLTLH